MASVSEFNCFLRSRCSMEMWCPDDIGRDSWDWVGPPAWRRACFNFPEWSGGSSPVKTEPLQIVLLLLLLLLLLQPSLTNMFRPFADFASQQWFRECICWILLTCNNIQLQVTKRHSTLQPQMTRLQTSQTFHDSSSSCNTYCC